MAPPTSRRLSLRARITTLTVILLTVALAGFSWVAYRSLQVALIRSAEARLDAVSEAIGGMLASGAERFARALEPVASDPAVRAYAAAPSPAAAEAARERLLAAAGGAQVVWVEVVPAGGAPLRVPGPAGRGAGSSAAPAEVDAPQEAFEGAIGPIRAAGGAAFYDVRHPLPGGGAVVMRRHISSPTAARQFSQLLGETLGLRLGAPGGAWTDLTGVIPEDAVGAAGLVTFRTPVAGTPWLLQLETARASALAPARALLERLLALGLATLLLAAAGAAILAGRLARPLERLTAAAGSISRGEYSGPTPVEGDDEVARLGEAFNRMAERVEESQHRLEERVRQRTGELERALAELGEAQDQLLRKEKLAMLGQLASGVAHELRNPLGVMTNALYYLDMRLAGSIPDDAREHLAILRAQVELSGRIVSDLLDFARLRQPRREVLDLAALVEAQIERLGPLDGITIVRDIPSVAAAVHADPVQLGQILLNLLSNAVQALERDGGTITVHAEPLDGTVTVEVHDTGPGIPPEHLERIFEPLYTTRARGIGLGLAVSRGLAEANGGSLAAYCWPGEGATFRLVLERAPRVAALP